ncbi:MAG: DUF4097 family beta strand repeat protein [Clostridia bacterium]|nr:DUF4097 family beta strand repeat protein [Clostridia bacterium]
MMNATVARIVDLMFVNTEMNDEVTALHDEVMNNCQERYTDLISAGMAEDDAVAAVVESLKGMEDVIAPYRRKAARAKSNMDAMDDMDGLDDMEDMDEMDSAAEDPERDLVFNPAEIHGIDLALVNEDVRLEESDDDMYHVRWDADDDPQIMVCEEGGTLRISRQPGFDGKKGVKNCHINVNTKGGKDSAHVYINGKEVHFDEAGRYVDDVMGSVGSIMEKMGLTIGRMFGGIRNAMSGGDGVTICIPHDAVPHVKLLTTSGDVAVVDAALADLSVTSTSGDVTLELNRDAHLAWAEIRTVSGDVDATLYADRLQVNTTSGDVEVNGCVEKLQAGAVSGDLDVYADVAAIQFKTISGDVDIDVDSDALREVNGSTISGDIDIDLPVGYGVMGIRTQTRSGDVTTRYSCNGSGPAITGSVSSMSGDITIR